MESINIIGRKDEQREFTRLYNSGQAEFVAVYGRRRVGKTYLVREFFHDKLTFYHTGLNIYDENDNVTTEDQLHHFYRSLLQFGANVTRCPDNWLDAFYQLEDLLSRLDDGARQIVFLDELSWLDTDGSKFLTSLEAFWNGWGASRHNLMLIVCGSAAGWMIKNLKRNRGGLFNRLTYDMHLHPFTLLECEQYLQSQDIHLSHYDITQAYMALGGIPYYYSYFRKGLSLAQNLDNLLCGKNAKLGAEFHQLFRSLFKNPEYHEEIIRFLSTRHCGFTRNEIAAYLNTTPGGTISDILDALSSSSFIEQYRPFDAQKYEKLYRLTDSFCRTWLNLLSKKSGQDVMFWQHNISSPALHTWSGIAFEEVCMIHVQQILRALGLQVIQTECSPYTLRGDDRHDGAQCDLVIRRADRVVNLCEMKFVQGEYVIDKDEDLKLRNRLSAVQKQLKRYENLHLIFVSSYGVKVNMYSSLVQAQVTLDDLFQ